MKKIKSFFKQIINCIDGLLIFIAGVLLDVTVYLKSWFAGGIVTAVTLIVFALLIDLAVMLKERR